MPYVNVKLVGSQVSQEQKKQVIEGLTDLIVNVMGRDRRLTVITIDELAEENWAIGGISLDRHDEKSRVVSFVNIKVSKGTTNPDEMSKMLKETKDLFIKIFGSCQEANYFIMDELNPDGWGLDGISMTQRRRGK